VQFGVRETARTVSAVTIKSRENKGFFDFKRILCHTAVLIFEKRHFSLLTIAAVREKLSHVASKLSQFGRIPAALGA
jgi:hypothetical protein